jgi:hypothetical protein
MISTNKKRLVPLLAGILLASAMAAYAPASLACCCAPCTPAVQEAKATLMAKIAAAESAIAAAVMTAQTSIVNAIGTHNERQAGEIQRQTKAITEALDAHLKEQAAISARLTAFQAMMTQEKAYPSINPNACEEEVRAEGMIEGDAVRAGIKTALQEKLSEHSESVTSPGQAVKRLVESSIEATRTGAASLLPEAGTMTPDEASAAVEFLKNLIDPTPPSQLDDTASDTAAGQASQALTKQREAQLSLPGRALTYLFSQHAPAYTLGTWADSKWGEMGYPRPDGIDTTNVGYATVISTLVDSRFSNSTYMAEVAAKRDDDLIRDLIISINLTNKLLLDQNEMMRLTMAMQAQSLAMQTDTQTRPALNQLRLQAAQPK